VDDDYDFTMGPFFLWSRIQFRVEKNHCWQLPEIC